MALLNNANWKCCKCNIRLDTNFHADHIIPYSKGGTTDVTNGQALCQTCNLRKGNKMEIQLRKWQEKALVSCLNHYKTKKTFLTQATPGGGKTIHGLSVYKELLQQGLVKKLIVLVPSRELISGWTKDASKVYGLELANKLIYSRSNSYNEYDGMIFTYSGMAHAQEDIRNILNYDDFFVIADEMHHISENATWGSAFKNALELSKHNLLLTGTPWTSKGDSIPYIDYDEEGKCKTDFQYSKSEAIKDGVCREVQFRQHKVTNIKYWDRVQDELLEYEDIEDAVSKGKDRAYGDAVQEISSLNELFSEADEQLGYLREATRNRAGGLIVCSNIGTAYKFRDHIYSNTGNEYPVVTSDDKDSVKIINDFRTSNTKWLISVKQVSEGVDIKRIQSIVFLSRAKTELFIRQVVGRCERVINQNQEADKVSYFHSLSHPWINTVIERMERENEAGVKLKEEKDQEEDSDFKEKSGQTYFSDIELQSIEHEKGQLISRGLVYDDKILIRAIELKKTSKRFYVMPLSVLCTIALAEDDGDMLVQTNTTIQPEEENYKGTKEEIKKRLREIINKTMKRKIAREYGTKQIPVLIKKANIHLNKRDNVFTVADATQEQLEARSEYVRETEVSKWVA